MIIGCGGFGREVADVIAAVNEATLASGLPPPWRLLGFIDDDPSNEDRERVTALGSRLLGSTDSISGYAGCSYTVGVGNGAVRERLAARADSAGLTAAVLVHPTATFGADVHVSAGAVICAGVRLTTNIVIGRHVHLNLNTTVGHDCVLEDFCSVNPLVAISGRCCIGARSMLGTHSAVLQGLVIGADAIVGAGACVTRDVAPGVTAKGVPAR